MELLRKKSNNQLIPRSFTPTPHKEMTNQTHIIVKRVIRDLKRRKEHEAKDKIGRQLKIGWQDFKALEPLQIYGLLLLREDVAQQLIEVLA